MAKKAQQMAAKVKEALADAKKWLSLRPRNGFGLCQKMALVNAGYFQNIIHCSLHRR